ncbi:uncharacterized protein Z520_07692 [Fonsecaea multimorphosa CBS 102226]|uniref:Quinate transporter n=1 Tax=Fonsecaea multimorphosa CBS 102226 TaxID=1442371 RepID=A0A0D2IHD1_9EURO|nr:uncharacterized protein Z520_07692 [Fonsecaea multimorphosa CBS 102226]KIX96426.1 hypothetical protein Z520_07692 [Fonsecaea multimorphosa CBS 102226]
MVLTYQAGGFLACFLSLPFAEMLGRKRSLILSALLFAIGASIQLVPNIGSFYFGRFIAGVGVGPLTVVGPLYLSEVSPAPIRGRCVGFFEIAYQLAGMLGFWINYGVGLHMSPESDAQWRIPVAIQLVLVGLFLCGSVLLCESPRFLIKQDAQEEARKVLTRLRRLRPDDEYITREMHDIQAELQLERHLLGIDPTLSRWQNTRRRLAECVRPQIMRRISCGMLCQLVANLSGINGINYYSPTIFKTLGVVGTNTGLFATGVYGCVKFITSIISLFWLVDRLGRRFLLLSGTAVLVFSLFFVGSYVKIADPVAPADGAAKSISGGGIAACAFIYIYVIGYVTAYGGVPYILSSEAVPLNVRAISSALGAGTLWLTAIAITKATPYMITNIRYGVFYFFGSCSFLGAIAIYFWIPETRGVPLEHMATVFGYEDEVGPKQIHITEIKSVADHGQVVEIEETAMGH